MRPDKLHPPEHNPGVTTERAYIERLLTRTRAARERLGKSQAEMAVLLQIPKDTYKTYETRSPLPHYLIEPFCGITGLSLHFFVTGKRAGAKPGVQEAEAPKVAHRPTKHAAERRRA